MKRLNLTDVYTTEVTILSGFTKKFTVPISKAKNAICKSKWNKQAADKKAAD
jgi:hypothetical protein